VGKMSLLENLPKEVKREEFSEFLENIKDDFPASEFPEIFIHYQQVNDKVLVLGIGKSGEPALLVYQNGEEEPVDIFPHVTKGRRISIEEFLSEGLL
jgi:hypothetical protein